MKKIIIASLLLLTFSCQEDEITPVETNTNNTNTTNNGVEFCVDGVKYNPTTISASVIFKGCTVWSA